MVNTLFTGKVMFVSQPIIMLRLGCRRLEEDGVKWLEKQLEYRELKQIIEGLSLTFKL
jgi:hypothetical protein